MILTTRQKLVIRAALGYALGNTDDLNDALAGEPSADTVGTISIGCTVAPCIAEGEVQTVLDLFKPTNRSSSAGLRTFTGKFFVTIDPSEADEDEQHPTLDDLIGFLKEAAVLDVDTEGNGNPFGVQGVELLLDTLEELPGDGVDQRS